MGSASTGSGVPVRRLVAVAVTDVDLLCADSDLRHVAGAAAEIDVLIARHDPVGPALGESPMEAEDYPDDDTSDDDTSDEDTGTPDGASDPATIVAAPVGGTLPAGMRLHRLGLRRAVRDGDEADLVAAMSELVGFDPDDRVFCVAPVAGPEPVVDTELAVLRRAIRRVARVYGLPVLPYRRLVAEVAPVVEFPAPPLACGG